MAEVRTEAHETIRIAVIAAAAVVVVALMFKACHACDVEKTKRIEPCAELARTGPQCPQNPF